MVRVNLQKAVVLYLTWTGALAGAFIVMLAEVLPFRLTFVSPGNFFACLLQCQLFFVVFVWPLFLRSLLREEGSPPDAPAGWVWVGAPVAVLAAVAFPLALVAANVSNVGFVTLLGAQLRVAAAAALVAAVFVAGAVRNARVGPAYLLAAFVLSAVPPFLHFLGRELGFGPDLSFLRWASPFWGALELDGSEWGHAAAFAAPAAAVALVTAGKARRGVPPAPTGASA